MGYLKCNLSVLSYLCVVVLIAGCGITSQKQGQPETKPSKTAQAQSEEGSSQVAQGSFALIQPDLNSDSSKQALSDIASSSQMHFDFFEIHLIPDRDNAVKDYVRKVAYAPGQTIQIDQIIAGSYSVEVNVYSGPHLALQGKASAQVKSNDAAKVDVDLKYVSDKANGSLIVSVHGPSNSPVNSIPPVGKDPAGSQCSSVPAKNCPDALPKGYHFGPASYDQNHCLIRCAEIVKD